MAELIKKTTQDFKWSNHFCIDLDVGDEISETLKDGRKVTFVVMHKLTNTLVLGLKGTLGDHVMNAEATNEGGWLASDMRTYLNEEVLDLLPDSLRLMIKPRVFSETAFDYLWLFSEEEIFGKTIYSEGEENPSPQLDYFKKPGNRVMLDEHGDPDFWWERSPYSSISTHFCFVVSSGTAANYSASNSRGVCFGFYL